MHIDLACQGSRWDRRSRIPAGSSGARQLLLDDLHHFVSLKVPSGNNGHVLRPVPALVEALDGLCGRVLDDLLLTNGHPVSILQGDTTV